MEFSEENVGQILRAVQYSAQKHRDQKRKSAEKWPYVNHPIEVAELLWRMGGVRDIDVITAAILHDTLEDTDATRQELECLFGKRATSMVEEVTDDKQLPKQDRRKRQEEHAPQLSPGAKLVKLGDKISNVGALVEHPPEGWSLEEQREYAEWGARVVNGLRGINPPLEAYFDEIMKKIRRKTSP